MQKVSFWAATETLQKRFPLVFWEVKVKEERNIFRLASFFKCNLTIMVELVFIVVLLVWTTSKGSPLHNHLCVRAEVK